MFGNILFMGTTEIVTRGSPIKLTIVVFTLFNHKIILHFLRKEQGETYKGGSEMSCRRARAVPTMPVTSTHIAG